MEIDKIGEVSNSLQGNLVSQLLLPLKSSDSVSLKQNSNDCEMITNIEYI